MKSLILLFSLFELASSQDWPYSCFASTNASSIVEGIDGTGKVIVITGADGNIGSHISMNVARTGATTVLACHNATNCENTALSLQAQLSEEGLVGNFDTLGIDLSDFTNIRSAAATLISRYDSVDVLVNNAATSMQDYLSADGLVVDMEVNHYGNALLTNLLLPVLINDAGTSRVVFVASASGLGPFVEQDGRTSLKYDSLQEIADVWSRNASSLSPVMYYGVSKFLVIQYNQELAKRYDGEIVTFAVSPGFAREPATTGQEIDCTVTGMNFSPCPMSYEQGATVEVLATLSPDIEPFSGSYLDFDTTYYPDAKMIQREWIQQDPSCMPRPLPGWLGTDGTDVMWTDDDRSEWYDIVQDIIGVSTDVH